MDDRKLTDADVEAIVESLRNEFFNNLGRGLWSLVWKGIVWAAIGLSLYGASKGFGDR